MTYAQLRKLHPHGSKEVAPDGRILTYTHNIGEYNANPNTSIYIPTDEEVKRYEEEEQRASDARYALRAYEYFD